MMPLRKTLFMTTLATLTAAAAPAHAQSGAQPGEIVFVDLGRWTIYEATSAGYCEMRLRSGINGTFAVRRRIGSPIDLQVTLNNSRSYGGDVVFAFDNVQFSGARQGSGTYATGNSTAIEEEFRKAETLSVLEGGATLASISLKASAAGHRLLIQCADQWRSGFIPPRDVRVAGNTPRNDTSAIPPSRSQPAAPPSSPASEPARQSPRGQFPANRPVTPRNTQDWIPNEDFRRLPELRGDGTLTFSLAVDTKGRVEECTVLKSTGSRNLDGRVCRALQKNARFEPATDANGNAMKSTYSSSVQFAVSQ